MRAIFYCPPSIANHSQPSPTMEDTLAIVEQLHVDSVIEPYAPGGAVGAMPTPPKQQTPRIFEDPGRCVGYSKSLCGSGDVESVKVHHFGPAGHKIVDELGLGVGGAVNFGEGPELGVGAEDEIDAGAGPF